MPANKTLWLLLLACIAINTYAVLGDDEDGENEETLYDQVQALYTQLKEVVHLEVSHALLQLTASLAEISALSETVLLQAERSTQAEKAKLERELNQIRAEAEADGRDYASCAAGRDNFILNLPTTVLEEIDSCVASLVATGANTASRAISRTMSVQQSVDRIQLSLYACNGEDQCLLGYLGTIAVDIVELPIGLRETTDATVDVVKALDRTIERCASDRESSIPTIGGIIIGEIRNCIFGS